jgi:hypothetical protein
MELVIKTLSGASWYVNDHTKLASRMKANEPTIIIEFEDYSLDFFKALTLTTTKQFIRTSQVLQVKEIKQCSSA